MKSIIISLLLIASSLGGKPPPKVLYQMQSAQEPTWQHHLHHLDIEIEKLIEQIHTYRMHAMNTEGDREDWEEYARLLKEAERSEAEALKLEALVHKLELQKQAILQQHASW